jgi:hypothetical protein
VEERLGYTHVRVVIYSGIRQFLNTILLRYEEETGDVVREGRARGNWDNSEEIGTGDIRATIPGKPENGWPTKWLEWRKYVINEILL